MLRWRLLIGLVSLFILLLAVGGYSIWLVARLQTDINSILKDNYGSIHEGHQLRLRLLRMNAAYLKPRVADTVAIGSGMLESTYAPELQKTLASLRALARTPEDQAHVARLTAEVEDYLNLFRQILSLSATAQERYDEMRLRITEKNLAMAAAAETILASRERAMMAAQSRAKALAGGTVRFLISAILAGLVVFIYAYYRLGKSLVAPIEELTQSLDAVRAGKFEKSLPVRDGDELSRLAQAFNAMSDELRTYRRDTDETIIRLNRSLRETIAAFPYPVMVLDASFAIWVTNEAADTFLKSIGNPDDLPEPLNSRIEEVRRTGSDYLPDGPADSLLFRVGEREVHYLPRILRIFSPEGEFSGAAVILIDVTRFRWLDDMKTNLISTISHEIRTPLTGIRMMLHLLLEKNGGDLTAMQHEMVQAACADCERLLSTLNSLLDLSRMEAGRAQLELQPVPPGELIEEARTAFQSQADAMDVRIQLEVEEELPAVLADRARMMHVIGNFTSNALKFAPKQSTIRLTADRSGADRVRLSVIDSGPGIPEQYHARIFDKFFQAPGHLPDGIGLGLSIARQIVHAHDGRTGVHSEPHVATRFYCELPIA
jgi:signal transduction histidine kinase/HAMP domain-containing protein